VLEIYGEHLRKQKTIAIVLAQMQLELIDGVILFRKRFHVARRCVRGQLCGAMRAARREAVSNGNSTDG
jgi:hypothetical protein